MYDFQETYWNRNGKYQAEYDELEKLNLVPNEGRATTYHGELLRCLNNIYYDAYNNGWVNLDLPHFKTTISFLTVFLTWKDVKLATEFSLMINDCLMFTDFEDNHGKTLEKVTNFIINWVYSDLFLKEKQHEIHV